MQPTGMKEKMRIVHVERLDGKLVVQFSNGTIAVFEADFLFENREANSNEVVGFHPPRE